MLYAQGSTFQRRSIRVAEWLVLPTLDQGILGSNPAGCEILSEPKEALWSSG